VRVAALSDIHGNLPALDAVLADVEAEGVDAIVCGGDTVGGPFSRDVFDRLASVPNTQFVRGNADREVLEGTESYGIDWVAERAILGEERLAVVATWPLTVELDIDGLGRTLFCHAIPSADDPIFTRITPDEDVVELLGGVEAGLVVCGHTHVQFDRMLSSGLRVVNTGSVGMPYEGRPGAFWALLGPSVELRRTEYHLESAVTAILEVGRPSDEQLAGTLLEPPDPEEVTAFFESKRV
jgi:predicted phosphodiesterase